MITILLAASTVAYILMMLFLRIGLEKASRVRKLEEYEPRVSVIVAARNEEDHIGRCIDSLFDIKYPSDKLEIIVVNDNSTDRTAEIIENRRHVRPFLALSTKPGTGNLRGKPNALSQGIAASAGEILMFTDADCTVDPEWVRETVQYFEEGVGVVGGFTLLQADSLFEGMQSLDWIFLFSLASATAGWNVPLTAIGNNLAVLRAAYDRVGGFEKIPFSVTEDYSLVQSICKKAGMSVRFPIDSRTGVSSIACRDWKQLFRQKQRWGVGGLDMVYPGILITTVWWIFRFSLIAGIFVGSSSLLCLSIATMISSDVVFLSRALGEFKAMKYFRYIVVFEIYFTFYALLIPFVAILSRNVVWKERKL